VITAALGAVIAGCSSFQPEDLDYHSVQTGDMPFAIEYTVYTPPGWSDRERLPLILYLHGAGDDHQSFEQNGANDYFDGRIQSADMPRVILVSPNGKLGFWEDWADGSRRYRTWIMEAVLPEVQRRYNTLSCPDHCSLMGISMGGFGALRFAYFASDSFSAVSALSAPIIEREADEKPRISLLVRLLFPLKRIFGEDFKEGFAEQNPYNAWLRDPGLRKMRLQLIWGADDGGRIRDSNRRFSAHLLHHNVEHDHFEFDGRHRWVDWLPNFSRVVNFLVRPGAGS